MFQRLDDILAQMAEDGRSDYIGALASEIGRVKTEYMSSRVSQLESLKELDAAREAIKEKDCEIQMLSHNLERLKIQNKEIMQMVDDMHTAMVTSAILNMQTTKSIHPQSQRKT